MKKILSGVCFAAVALVALQASSQSGDVNGDESVDVLDLQRLVEHIQGVEPVEEAQGDLSGDGVVDVRDIVLMLAPVSGCESAVDCGPGHDCTDGRCVSDGHLHDHRANPVPDPEPDPEPEPEADTCCASTAFKLSIRTAGGGGQLFLGPDYIDYRFVHACLGRTQDDPALVEATWLAPLRASIERGQFTDACDQISLDDESGERRIEGLNCETTFRFRTGSQPVADSSETCQDDLNVEFDPQIDDGPDPEPDPQPDPEPDPGPEVDPATCGGLPGCLAQVYVPIVPEVDVGFAEALLEALFPDKVIKETLDGELQVMIITEDGSTFVVHKARGTMRFIDASLGDPEVPEGMLSAEQAAEIALDFFSDPVFGGAVEGASLASVRPEGAREPGGEVRFNNMEVRYIFEVDASTDPNSPVMVPLVGQSLIARVGGDGRILGFEFDRVVLEAAGSESVLTVDVLAAELASLPTKGHPGAIPEGGARLIYAVPAVDIGIEQLQLDYLLNPGAEDEGSNHTHNLRHTFPATTGRLSVRIISPDRLIEQIMPGDVVDISEPIRFEAEIEGGTPPYEVTWHMEDAVLEAFDGEGGFPVVGVKPIQGNPIEVRLAPDKRTQILVRVKDATGLQVHEQALLVTGLEAAPEPVEVPGTLPEPVGNTGEVQEAMGCPDYPDEYISGTPVSGYGWSMKAEITENDGLELSSVRFRGSKLAARMMLPNYQIETQGSDGKPIKCELGAAIKGEDEACRSIVRGPGIQINPDAGLTDDSLIGRTGTLQSEGRLEVRACWCVENIPSKAFSNSTLEVCQVFKFHGEGEGCSPDPTGIKCAKWEPVVEYAYETTDADNAFVKLVTNQRHDYDMDAKLRAGDRFQGLVPLPINPLTPAPGAGSTVYPVEVAPIKLASDGDIATFNQDHDSALVVLPGTGVISVPPLFKESSGLMANFGAPGTFDAHHQLGQIFGTRTGIYIPGCTVIFNHISGYQCLHSHWRWGAFIDSRFLDGSVMGDPLHPIPGINAILALRGKATIPPGSFGNGLVLVPASQRVTVHTIKLDSDLIDAAPSALPGEEGAEFFDPERGGAKRRNIESNLRTGLTVVLILKVRSFLGIFESDEEATKTSVSVGKGFNKLADTFFAQFRSQKGADLVTHYEVESRAAGTRKDPEIIQKNAHFFFR